MRVPKRKQDVIWLLEDLPILELDTDNAMQAAEIYHQLRRSNQMIEFRDIFIAAICIAHELPLYTLNTKHFERIASLKLYTP